MPRLSLFQQITKRIFDLVCATIGLFLLWWLIILAWLIAALETRSNGFFTQIRVGRNGKFFKIIKIKTMYRDDSNFNTVTLAGDLRITKSGKIFRKYKLDELPQLWNVLWGQMSFVGPRPDVPGFADFLPYDSRLILSIRPGITGPASLKYKNEELLLASQSDPIWYNLNVIWPDKVSINTEYIEKWSFSRDLYFIFKTLI